MLGSHFYLFEKLFVIGLAATLWKESLTCIPKIEVLFEGIVVLESSHHDMLSKFISESCDVFCYVEYVVFFKTGSRF